MNTKRLHHRWDRADKRENVLFRREARMTRDAEAFADQILAATEVEAPAMTYADCETEAYIEDSDRAIAQLRTLLGVEPLADWERDLLGLPPLDLEGATLVYNSDEADMLDAEAKSEMRYEMELERDLFEDWDDFEDVGTLSAPWMPLCSIEQAREVFGGGDFIVLHANVGR